MVAIASAVLGLFSFTLPATPPQAQDGEKQSIASILGFDALKLLGDRNFPDVLYCLSPYLYSIGFLLPERQPISIRNRGGESYW